MSSRRDKRLEAKKRKAEAFLNLVKEETKVIKRIPGHLGP